MSVGQVNCEHFSQLENSVVLSRLSLKISVVVEDKSVQVRLGCQQMIGSLQQAQIVASLTHIHNELSYLLKKKGISIILMNDCMICYDKLPDQNTYRFTSCGHKFCLPCVREAFEGKIKSKMVSLDNFVCPQCNQPFDVSLLKQIVSPPIFQKYCEFSIDAHQIYGLQEDELFVSCLNKDCRQLLIIWKGAEYQVCPHCKKKYCRKCFLPFHEPQSCEWAIQENEKLLKDQLDNMLILNYKMAKCPYCHSMVEKNGGCNHITCRSMLCQGKQHFCYTCSAKLTDDFTKTTVGWSKYSHWKDHSPHSPICKIWYNNQWTPKESVPKEHFQQLEQQKNQQKSQQPQVIAGQPAQAKKQNTIPCPRCKSTDPQVTELLFENNLIFCQSTTCKEHRQCMQCKEILEEGDIADHYNLQLKCRMC